MMRFINPKTDYAFKKIFGSTGSKDILKSFLNALIYEGHPTIEDLEIINPNLPPQLQGLKDTYLDVRARLIDGSLVIIEMQVLNVQSFGKRVLFNAAKTYFGSFEF
jgi:predicted transposase/invertase (TIGR01784 family)